ncbi:RNA polymerase sigma-70 factor [Terrabacter sp. Soil810]|uniref:RNA polymerase sigma-70 factor n=1 Tax=Terrabacter sp. Soil810 TaxID=1736418 RepID=UPI000709EAE4|nr:RNA polymerase sigma-70 factor [Terrabacter sp. Soil810]KRF38411.1 RNA polymerase subunit sigma-24 [Terrabacter sp. Soil810]
MTDLAQAHDDLRPLMFSIAYRMLGSVAEAEDVVQDAFLKMHRALAEGTELDSPDAYATTVTTRLAIDTLRSARVRREEYVGPWLPEPLVPERAPDPASRFELEDSVSVAMLVLMESLSPVERAVFILRETLGYDYAEIAAVVGQSEATCRQHFSRAHKRLGAGPRFEASQERRDELAAAFLAAVRGGGLEDLEQLLADDVVFYGDGGGKAPAIRTPMHGSVAVARFLLGLVRRGGPAGVSLQPAHANGGPAALTIGPDGALLGVLTIEVADGRIIALHNQINPDKLQHLGRVGDLNALMREGTTPA